MLGEINKDSYCTAYLYNGDNKLKVCDPHTRNTVTGDCIGVCEKCNCYHRKWPTPEQFFEEYGLYYPDDGAVYEADIDQGNKPTWIIASYWTAKKMGKRHIICACTPWGMPPADWRP